MKFILRVGYGLGIEIRLMEKDKFFDQHQP